MKAYNNNNNNNNKEKTKFVDICTCKLMMSKI